MTDLSFCSTNIGDEPACISLFDAIAESKVLECFSLIIIDGSKTLGAVDEIVALLRLLEQCPIRSLCLNIDHFREEEIARMCNALADKPLECLDLGKNMISSEGAAILGRFVGTHTILNTLVLLELFDGEGLKAFQPGLENSPCLQKLTMQYCEVKSHSLAAMAEYLKMSRWKELRLVEIICESPVFFIFAEALKESRTLEILTLQLSDMERHPYSFGADEEAAFIDALSHNVTLTELIINGGRNATIGNLLLRNKNLIPAVVRRAALFLIGIRRSTNDEGMGDFAVFPKDVVRLLAQAVWATRRDPVWIQALE